MKIASIGMNFGAHARTEIALPKTGVLVVTGANGQGKSSCVEAVAHAIWDETIRGKSMWSATERSAGKKAAKLALEIFLYDEQGNASERVFREAKAKGTTLDFSMPWGTRESYENQPKAQEALEGHLGSFDVWRKTSVFSASDVDSFTSAPDGDRKRLLESILGLERLDDAYDSALKDQREKERAVQTARSKLDRVEYAITSKRRAVEAAEARHADAGPSVPIADLEELYEAAKADCAKRKAALLDAARTYDAAYGVHSRLARSGAAIADSIGAAEGGECESCGQEIPHDHAAISQLHVELSGCQAEIARAANDLLAANEARIAAEAHYELGKDVFGEASAALSEGRSYAKIQASAADVLRTARTELEDELDLLDEATAGLQATEKAQRVAEAVSKVLSTKGVRAHILGGALSAVEEVANVWLTKVVSSTREMELKLSAYTQSAKGVAQDALGLEVIGAGGGHGYKGASSGERRRIDVALMLALAEVAEYAHGVAPGTLFFDEVFDALDDEGVEAICDVITELGQTRCIVVITHNQTLANGITGVTDRFEAKSGTLVRKP